MIEAHGLGPVWLLGIGFQGIYYKMGSNQGINIKEVRDQGYKVEM